MRSASVIKPELSTCVILDAHPTSLTTDALYHSMTTPMIWASAMILAWVLSSLGKGKSLGKLSNRTLSVLRSLAYNFYRVPNRCKIDRSLAFDVDPAIFASGGFSDIRISKGELERPTGCCQDLVYGGGWSDPSALLLFFYTNRCMLVVAFLQGDYPLEEHLSASYTRPLRSRDRRSHREVLDDLRTHGKWERRQFHSVQPGEPASSGN